jgi:predicted metal-dependent phosphoesterase TrpH
MKRQFTVHVHRIVYQNPPIWELIEGFGKILYVLKVEFHSHTIASKDSLLHPADLVVAARRKGIDRVVVTDHDSIAGALEAKKLDPERVLTGEEIMTTRGEILAAYVTEEVPPGLSPKETIRRLREQGAFISVSHPFDRLREGGWLEPDLQEILHLVDAIEVFNSRCMLPRFNTEAGEFAIRNRVPGTVGSDAHAAFELGRSLLLVEPFENPEELRVVIRKASTQVRWSPPWFHLVSRYASMRKKMKIGLDTSN